MITLVATVLNERENIETFMYSVFSQTQKPDEVIILDGGSTDGTLEYLKSLYNTVVLSDPFCNIKYFDSPVARGRNHAIGKAKGDIIAVADGGCVLDLYWLEALMATFEKYKVDVVGGRTEPLQSTGFRHWAGSILAPDEAEMQSIMNASSRSVAFKRRLWAEVGGYPEIALTAEDTFFNQKLLKAGAVYIYEPEAVVYWQPPKNLYKLMRQFYRYSKGDAICGLRKELHFMVALRLLFPPYYFLSPLKFLVDLPRVVGYTVGIIKRWRGKTW